MTAQQFTVPASLSFLSFRGEGDTQVRITVSAELHKGHVATRLDPSEPEGWEILSMSMSVAARVFEPDENIASITVERGDPVFVFIDPDILRKGGVADIDCEYLAGEVAMYLDRQ